MNSTWISRNELPSGYIPCCPGLLRADDGREYLPQTDYEWPSVARSLGWDMGLVQVSDGQECRHSSTDGTVDCRDCGTKASEFIGVAFDWLADNGGLSCDGYFD